MRLVTLGVFPPAGVDALEFPPGVAAPAEPPCPCRLTLLGVTEPTASRAGIAGLNDTTGELSGGTSSAAGAPGRGRGRIGSVAVGCTAAPPAR